jgi:hypothetical protein
MYPDCGNDFSRKFICDNFIQSFVTGELKKHREDIYFEQEKALLPATQARVVEINREEERIDAHKVRVIRLRNLYKDYNKERKECEHNFTNMFEFKAFKYALLMQYQVDVANINSTYDLLYNNRRVNIDDPEARKHRFIRPCSDTGCKGFLSTAWKCGLCEKHACSQCHMVLEGDKKEHVCDPDTLATAKLIVSQSKPCPGCHINISKIDGCNQMWCTICNTAWDWKSGRIETKVHNPHYFEYMRNRATDVPRNPNEVICGRELDINFVTMMKDVARPYKFTTKTFTMLQNTVTGMSHLTRFHIRGVGDSPDAVHLRVKFMRNKIDEKQFKREVQMLYKKFYKEKDIQEVLVMMKHLITEICYRYLDGMRACVNQEEVTNLKTLYEIETLIDYVNETLKTIAKTYQSTVYAVSLDPKNKNTYGLKSVNGRKLSAKTKSDFEALRKLEVDYLEKGVFPSTPYTSENDSWFTQWVISMRRKRIGNLGSMKNDDFRQAWVVLVEKYSILFDADAEKERKEVEKCFDKAAETRKEVIVIDK